MYRVVVYKHCKLIGFPPSNYDFSASLIINMQE